MSLYCDESEAVVALWDEFDNFTMIPGLLGNILLSL